MYRIVNQGRLGNEMFQYAMMLALRHKTKGPVFLSSLRDLPNYFEIPLRLQIDHIAYRSYYRAATKIRRNEILPEQDFEDCTKIHSVESLTKADHCSIRGYFQSHRYFEEVDPIVRKHFQVKRGLRQQFQARHRPFNGRSYISVHIRRGDYLNLNLFGDDSGLNLPAEYFLRGIQHAVNETGIDRVCIVSDDPVYASEVALKTEGSIELRHGSVIDDFQIILNANACVSSNSTFSWWGAFLNPKRPFVVAPQYFLGFKNGHEFPHGIMQPEWHQLPVYE